ncbi:MAG: Uma2 family endonuclease [Thermomicrobiales bacterium]
MNTAIARYRFTVADYEQMVSIGIFAEDDRVELLEGEIITMSPIGDRHVGCINALTDLLAEVARQSAIISVQNPIRLSDNSQPQPDIALVRRSAFTHAVPMAADVLLVIEIANSSLGYDRTLKLPRYAAAGIPEAWLIDLGAETIERHTEPRDGYYRFAAFAMRGDTLASTVLPALTIPADLVLGPAEE